MTQRNFQNARNMGDGPKGKSKKSAGKAKIKSKAGSSVYTPSKEAKQKAAKKAARSGNQPAGKGATDSAEQQKRREQAMVSMVRDMPEYKYWRRIWWILMGLAFFIIIATWIPGMLVTNGILDESFRETASWVSSIGFIFAFVALIGAFYIDFRKIRKLQKAQEARARNLTKPERKKLDAAIEKSMEAEQARRAARKGKMPWSKKKSDEAQNDETQDAEASTSTDEK